MIALTFCASADIYYTWTGAIDETWTTAGNWDYTDTNATPPTTTSTIVPGASDTLKIPVTANKPEITTSVTVGDIAFSPGAVLKISGASGSLTVSQNFALENIDTTSNGTIVVPGGITLSSSSSFQAENLSLTISGTNTPATVKAASLSIGTITATTNNTQNLILESTATTGTISTGPIGTAITKFDSVTYKSSGNITYTSSDNIQVNSSSLKFISIAPSPLGNIVISGLSYTGNLELQGQSLSLDTLTLSGELTLNQAVNKLVSLSDISAGAVHFSTSNKPSFINLKGNIIINGNGDFITPTYPTPSDAAVINLTGGTVIDTTSSSSNGDITLYDNLTGGTQDLTIKNKGVFTLADVSSVNDITPSPSQIGSFSQEGDGTSSVSGDIIASGTILFAKAVALSGDVKFTSAGTTTFESDISGSHDITIQGDAVTSGTVEISTNRLNAKGNFTNTGNLTNKTTINADKDFTNSGTWLTDTNDKVIFNGAGNQTFNSGNGTYSSVEENKTSGSLTINDSANVTAFTITNATSTVFEDNQTIGTLSLASGGTTTFNGFAEITTLTDYSTSGDISFNAGGIIKTDTVFNTTGTLTFGSSSDTFIFATSSSANPADKNITHTAGQTIITGTLKGATQTFASTKLSGTLDAENAVTISTATINGASTIKSNSINFIGAISGLGKELTLESTGSSANISIKDTLLKTLTFTAQSPASTTLTLTGTLTTADTITFPYPTTIDGTIISQNGNAVFNSALILAAASTIGDSTYRTPFIVSKNSTVNLQSSGLSLTGSTLFLGKLNAASSSSGLSVAKDFVISHATGTDKTEINAPVIAKNIVLYKGELAANANMTSRSDIVLFGSAYDEKDHISQLPGIYTYKNVHNNTAYDAGTPAKLPSGDFVPASTDYSGKLTTKAGITLVAGKNFYANGLSAQDSSSTPGDWTLKIKSNYNTDANFAQAFYSDFSSSSCKVEWEGSPGKIVAEGSLYPSVKPGYETGWDLDDFFITSANTVDDNVVKVEFNRHLKNLASYLNNHIGYMKSSSSPFDGIFTDASCTIPLAATDATPPVTPVRTVFIRAPESATWNTDANGTDAGKPISTDKKGVHKDVIPYLDIPRNTSEYTYFITDLYGKRLAHYHASGLSSNAVYSNVTDGCAPVLVKVRTGQEIHRDYDSLTGESCQPSYDAHNFIEFRYSEEVNFGDKTGLLNPALNNFNNTNLNARIWLPASAATVNPTTHFADTQNVRVNDKFGVSVTDITSDASFGFTLLGLGQIEKGQIYTGSAGAPNKYTNALYRPDKHSIRLSIAGWTDGITSDRNGFTYKNWKGYIEKAVLPSGSVTTNALYYNLITDLKGNNQGDSKIAISVDSTQSGLYGKWDTSEPIFAPFTKMNQTGSSLYHEAVGNTTGSGSTLDKIEFHFFDNAVPDSADYSWITEQGWSKANKKDELYKTYSYSADIFGGSRQFADDPSTRTSGGIRFCSIVNISGAFKYIAGNTDSAIPTKPFVPNPNAVYPGAKAALFTGSSATRRSADVLDGLYFGLKLSEMNYPTNTSFVISYDETQGYATDLAGNRLRSAKIKTIDRTPPSIDMTLASINQNEITIVFVKNLETNNIKYIVGGLQHNFTIPFAQLITKCFKIIEIDSTGNFTRNNASSLIIDESVPAKIKHITSEKSGKAFTAITLATNRKITFEDLKNYTLQLTGPSDAGFANNYSFDPVTNIFSAVTFIQDTFGNFLPIYSAHSLSDFAINSVNPLYAYPSDIKADDEKLFGGVYEKGTWAVHDWNADQQNYGTLPVAHSFDIVAEHCDGVEETRMYISANPISSSLSTQINEDLNLNLRVWLPNIFGSSVPACPAIAPIDNPASNFFTIEPEQTDIPNRITYKAPLSLVNNWTSGQQVSFLFSILDAHKNPVAIYNSPFYDVSNNKYDLTKSQKIPLFALRLADSSDILSLDLWSVKLKSSTSQRGGITILNNVINVTNGEKVTLKVNLPSDGKLNVIITTLDGNVIKYLARGQTNAGEHLYTWDGKNTNGNNVARGMYFIRVTGIGIDETRKIMVVK
ncbi:FlgD immunoglobulin-like domain containing protein [Treponema sp. Marseille-Q3903]|uniref:FlgD immunoglobulin-like domain containing protein n=1 Tax=Treponema sp. Marseille-Q3903 TaxID=2766703 RepID=UPI001651B73A|nr:FlgD immunoglobulin-like domain containing protein [Treponema sp. Marseille-Q3903]MBC6712497.1 hypothetical protein [Treponema sp. Marseille-Q3903]